MHGHLIAEAVLMVSGVNGASRFVILAGCSGKPSSRVKKQPTFLHDVVKQLKEDNFNPEVTQMIDKIVKKRKECKKAMKNALPEKVVILDIQQKSYKIVANSIYGCLGFKNNRFYSKHLAALVTRKGREALMRGRDIVENRGVFRVIYGDTDSLMIQPVSFTKESNFDKILELREFANDLKKEINRAYANLEIDIDGIYKPLILLQKKKYVANKLTNYEDIIFSNTKVEPKFTIEYKGIEVVRRDGCPISRAVLKNVIDILMKG